MFIILHLRRLSEAQSKPNELRHILLIPVQGVWNTRHTTHKGGTQHTGNISPHSGTTRSYSARSHPIIEWSQRKLASQTHLGKSPTTAATARDHQVNTEASWSRITAQHGNMERSTSLFSASSFITTECQRPGSRNNGMGLTHTHTYAFRVNSSKALSQETPSQWPTRAASTRPRLPLASRGAVC